MLKTIYFVRHGQSEGNVAPVFQSYDSPLSAIGQEQARVIAERAANLQFDVLLSSPQMRARQTAEVISRLCGKEIETNDLFIERFKPSSIDGKPWEDEHANALWQAWERSLVRPGLKVEDGENYDEIIARADMILDYLHARPEQAILVVSHGHIIRTVIARVLLMDGISGPALQHFHEVVAIENTALSAITFDESRSESSRWRLKTLNDHAHFAD